MTYPPRADSAPTVLWSHWAMARVLRRLDPPSAAGTADATEPGTWWVRTCQLASASHSVPRFRAHDPFVATAYALLAGE
ncbi:hypothetical protein ACWD0Z_25785 [Streptomyces sp. NPDC003007]